MSRRNPFRHLRGKMTLTYTAVTGGVFLLLWFATVLLILAVEDVPEGSSLTPPILGIVADDIEPFLQSSPPDQDGLRAYLDLWVSGDRLRVENEDGELQAIYHDLKYVAVTDSAGSLLAIEPQVIPIEQETLDLPPAAQATYAQILAGQTDFEHMTDAIQGGETTYTMMSLADGKGVLIIAFGSDSVSNTLRQEIASVTIVISISMLCGTALIGTFFGWIASAGLVRRLRRLQSTVTTWEKGDLSPRINDKSEDEIGQLSRDLNQMAQQLDRLMTTQGELAAVEERNRLARELHDTVKQQIFAANMQLASARMVIQDSPDAADKILHEVETLTHQIQTELTDLIEALRPAALADQGLVVALREYINGWSQRTAVPVECVVQGERPLPLAVEQELYRVVQEALANVDKHAQAKQVIIKLSWQPHALTLEVQDDGIGFDSSNPTTGFGLQSMNDRLAALPGLVTVESHPGEGTRVTAVVELDS